MQAVHTVLVCNLFLNMLETCLQCTVHIHYTYSTEWTVLIGCLSTPSLTHLLASDGEEDLLVKVGHLLRNLQGTQ